MMKRFRVPVTTAADGSATAFSPRVAGELHSIAYIKDGGANPFANGVDFIITKETTGEGILAKSDVNASATFYPRTPTHSPAGVGLVYAAAGEVVSACIGLANDRVKIVIAQGGNTKVGAFDILVDC